MYVYVDGTGTDADQNYIQANPSDGFALIYSGLRWQALQLPLFNLEEGRKFWQWQVGYSRVVERISCFV